MTPEQLKASILQYAIQGKLVEQRVEEGTAEELYQQIQAEKQRLIEEKKIKKEKPLADIPHDEIPFDIPESWKWVNIAEMSIFQEGPGILAKDFRAFGVPLIRIAGMQGDILSLEGCNYLDEVMVENKWNHFRLDLGDILISTSASMDKICEVDEQTVGAIPYTGQIRFKMLGGVSKEYFKWFIKSPCYMKQIDNQKTGGMIKHYGPSHLRKMFVPLPPLVEQKRIVAKIEELLPLVDRYAASYEKLEQFTAKFPEDMKKSILQYAIQGKLVEQRPEEGTGEELYQRIKEEIRTLEKQKKFKVKDNSDISEDETPFDIPETWKWVRLGQILNIESGKGLTAKQMKPGEIPVFGGNGITGYHNESLIEKETVVIGRVGFYCGSIHITPPKAWVTDNAFITTYPEESINREYLVYVLRHMDLGQKSNATAQPVVSGKKIYPMLFPLPPLAEQKRIVAKIEELLPLCERLK